MKKKTAEKIKPEKTSRKKAKSLASKEIKLADKKNKKEVIDTFSKVQNLTDKVQKMIIEELKTFEEQERWLISGRVLNAVFGYHYGMSIKTAEERITAETKKDAELAQSAVPSK